MKYLFEKANLLTVFLITGAASYLMSLGIWYSLAITDTTNKLTIHGILVISSIFGVIGGLLFLTTISEIRKSTKFWDYAKVVEKQIDSADSKELLDYIHKGEFEILRGLCQGGPQTTELNRLYTIMKTKYKYVK